MNRTQLLKKYDVPVPRYTSYPTVPYWSDSPTPAEWLGFLNKAMAAPQSTWSLYVHVPFCETLCTYCGCNTVITKGHERELPYVDRLLKEFENYVRAVPAFSQKTLMQFHIGGGTPTFLSVEHLQKLVGTLLSKCRIDAATFDGSIEVDPRRTTNEQLKALYDLGFRRVSLGVQDFDPEVQRLVNRIQPFEVTKAITDEARRLGYQSVNFDLIYGLPNQSLASFRQSIAKTIALSPDRIALYSLAVVPWIKPQQRLFKDEDLPVGEAKRALFEMAYEELLKAGYLEIGMDHFAKPHDAMAKALKAGHLHRNFMGYTESRTDVLLGLGVSSISETPECFHQNEKVLPVYEQKIDAGETATFRGHKLSPTDQRHREQILEFMTQGRVTLDSDTQAADAREFLADMIRDGLVSIKDRQMSLTDLGRPFLRNACVVLDERLRSKQPSTKVFSQAL